MFIKYKNEYNEKIDFKMLYFLNSKRTPKNGYMLLKDIFYKNRKAISEQEIEFEKLKNVFLFLKSSKDFSEKECIKSCEMLNLNEINKNKTLLFMKEYYEKEKMNKPLFYVWIYWYIIKEKVFESYSLELALIVFDIHLKNNSYIPMIFSRKYLEFTKRMIDSNITVESLYNLFSSLRDFSLKHSVEYNIMTKNEIVEILLGQKNKLLENFGIVKVWLYGSFVRDEATKYSDIDLFVQINSKIKKYKNKNDIFTCLKEILGRRVDVQFEGEYFEGFSEYPFKEREVIFDAT
ncbi:MAG: Nucleotidyltransferase domain protein [Candidatus Izimaplasma bacterium HR2]|nr:MAG: Nucleotidyltransferase domain protein [Candidatus Izimaplasma bacterium HR2]